MADATERARNAHLRVPASLAAIALLLAGIAYLVSQTWALPRTPTPSGWLAPEFSITAAAVITWAITAPLESYWRKKKVPGPADFAFEIFKRLWWGAWIWLPLVGAILGLEALGVGRPAT